MSLLVQKRFFGSLLSYNLIQFDQTKKFAYFFALLLGNLELNRFRNEKNLKCPSFALLEISELVHQDSPNNI